MFILFLCYSLWPNLCVVIMLYLNWLEKAFFFLDESLSNHEVMNKVYFPKAPETPLPSQKVSCLLLSHTLGFKIQWVLFFFLPAIWFLVGKEHFHRYHILPFREVPGNFWIDSLSMLMIFEETQETKLITNYVKVSVCYLNSWNVT